MRKVEQIGDVNAERSCTSITCSLVRFTEEHGRRFTISGDRENHRLTSMLINAGLNTEYDVKRRNKIPIDIVKGICIQCKAIVTYEVKDV